MNFKNILITGGAGYVGHVLTEKLLTQGYNVTVYDICMFGSEYLEKLNSNNLKILKNDIRDIDKFNYATKNVDAVIHLACISNDPSFELNSELSKTINFDCFEDLVKVSKENGIKRFIYCSSSSVYGISNKENVTEDDELVPLTLYNEYKAKCEPILLNHTNDNFEGVIIRPATLCGYSPRMRFDLTVNILTSHAIIDNKINVFGGKQMRPNLHINDMVSVYELLLNEESDKIANQIFNIGYQNYSVEDIAKKVKLTVSQFSNKKEEVDIIFTSSEDNRSYRINSDKIKNILGFTPNHTIEDAVKDICQNYLNNNFSDIKNNQNYYNVKKLLDSKFS